MCIGSLLALTDPIALLETIEEMGANHHFIALIELEALLNDATGILLFLLFKKMSSIS